MHTDVNGLVIGVMDVRERDRFLTVLTDTLGKIRVSAKGASGRLGALSQASQLFSLSQMTLFENKGQYRIDTAEPISQFFGISGDIERLALASYIAELLGAVTDEGEDCSSELRLGVLALKAIEKGGRDMRLIKAAFEFRLMAIAGFGPELHACAMCGGEPEEPEFSVTDGMLLCGECSGRRAGGIKLPLTRGALDAMRYVMGTDSVFSFSLGEVSTACFASVAESYTLCMLERNFKTLDFWKSISTH